MADKDGNGRWRLNGDAKYIFGLAILVSGWVWSISAGYQRLGVVEKQLDKKANMQYVEQAVRRIDEKLNLILEQIPKDK
ncbi:MAG: hypothetical protein JRL30_25680 [Deltaproteobacteria bacterium]|nr:hypothetical protein [Deltaproteobacteria bacterium]